MYARTFNRLRLRSVKPFFIQQVFHIETPFKLIHCKVVPISRHYGLISKSLIRLYSSDGDLIFEPEPLKEHLYEESLPEFSFTKILYTEDDPKIKVLNQCKSPDELLDMFEREGSHFQTNQLVQTVVLLWNFCRKKELYSPHIREYIQTHIAFESLLLRLLESAQFLNSDENTCCYLYLKRIGINSSHKLMQQLLLDNLYTINKDEDIPLSVLSRFSVAVSFDSDLNTILVCHDMMPHLLKSLKKCNSAEELRLITLCLSNIRQMVSSETLEMYKTKVNELMRTAKVCTENTKCILKVLNFLNHPVWSHRNFSLSRRLILLLSPVVDNLSENEVTALLKIFQNQLEPAAIVPKLLKVSEKLLKKYPTQEMLASVIQFVEPKKREHFINLFQKLLKDESMWEHPNAALYFFTVLRALKISDSGLCDDYWTRVLNKLDSKAEEREYYVFSRHCRRYMYFNNNLGGTYRHIEFEKRLTQLCMDEINTGISGVIPSKFANIASFVIGYGHTYRGNSKLPVVILNKIESMENQFSVSDCLQLSRGIQIALEMRFRQYIPKTMVTQLTAVENELNKCTQRHLKNLKIVDANDINAVVRALINRKASRKSIIYQEALNKYNNVQSNTLNSRMLRNMSFNLSTSHFVAPQILEKMFAYIMKHEQYVTGDTAEKILSCSYNLGYSPQLQGGLNSAANILIRDFDYMTGLSIIQACLALCFFKTLPEQLINKVFSVDFIKRIEEEIGMCYSKATYPERVLNYVMQLNRAVCLDFPEADIPWFQQNYIEAQLSKHPFVQNKYNEEIRQSLLYVLKDESFFRCNHITPYGYRIDFVIHFDKGKKPIPTPIETTVLDKITKVAILLLRMDSFCENDLNTLRGKEALKMRHLEMLGYKVIYINETNWKHMSAQNDKTNYIKCLLQIST